VDVECGPDQALSRFVNVEESEFDKACCQLCEEVDPRNGKSKMFFFGLGHFLDTVILFKIAMDDCRRRRVAHGRRPRVRIIDN
jgi:hypothetical protein